MVWENLYATQKCDLRATHNISNDIKYNEILTVVYRFKRSLTQNFIEWNYKNVIVPTVLH